MKKTYQFFLAIIVLALIVLIPNKTRAVSKQIILIENNPKVLATESSKETSKGTSLSIPDIIEEGDDFLNAGTEKEPISKEEIKGLSSSIFNVLYYGGIIISGIISVYLGIKIMFSSVEQKAEYKDRLMPFLVGSIVTFGALTIWKVVVTFMTSNGLL